MKWNFTNDKPIFIQMAEEIELKIVSGDYKMGTKLPSIRDFSADAGVNANTVQKAMSALEKKDLIKTYRTRGKFVTEDQKLINNLKINLATKAVERLYKELSGIGYAKEEAMILIEYVIENIEKKKKQALESEINLNRNDRNIG